MNILISLRISYCLKPGTDHSVHSLLMPKPIDAAEVKGGKKPLLLLTVDRGLLLPQSSG